MIKDILVNLSYGTSQDGVSNYALSVAETFGAHIIGTAFAYIRQWPVALACRLTLFEPSNQKLKNAQSPWPPRLTRRRVAPAFQPKRAGLKLALATYQPSLRISQDDSIFPSWAKLKGTGIIRPRISSLRRRCSNPEDRCSSFPLFRRIASNSIMSWCAGMAAGRPRERSPMPCRFLPAPARRVLLLRTLRAPKAQTFRVRISRPIWPVTE